MMAMAVKEFRQLRRDHRTVAMMIVMPLVLLVVFGYAASFDVTTLRVAIGGPAASQVQSQLPARFEVVWVDPSGGREQVVAQLQRAAATVGIVADPVAPAILLDGADLFGSQAALRAIAALPTAPLALVPKPEVLFNPELKTSTIMVPALMGMILVFIGTVITSLGVVRERQSGTLEQLAVMPIRPRDVFLGKILPYFGVALLDTAIVVLAGMLIFGVPFNGNPAVFALGVLLFLFVTLGLGVLISTVSENQGQAIQLAIMTLLPQVLLSGLIFPLESMAAGVRWIGYLLPLTYFTSIARGVMVRGTPFEALGIPFLGLAILGAVVFSLAVIRFRRDLAPSTGGPRRGRGRIAAPTPAGGS